MTENHINKDNKLKSQGKLWLGAVILVVGFLSPLLIPAVLASKWSATIKSIISGLLAFGIPELFMFVAIIVMGKEGYHFIKDKAFKFLKRFAPPNKVSKIRYKLGLVMFTMPLIVGVLSPYLGYYFSIFKMVPLWLHLSLDLIFIIAIFVLGGDFWDKLSSLFKYDMKIIKIETKN